MHDINYIRLNSTEFDNAMKLRGEPAYSQQILKIDEDKRTTADNKNSVIIKKP